MQKTNDPITPPVMDEEDLTKELEARLAFYERKIEEHEITIQKLKKAIEAL